MPDAWSWTNIAGKAREALVAQGWPIPRRPQTSIDLLSLPEDVDKVGDLQLANLTLRLQAWYAYATSHLAFTRAEESALSEAFEVRLGVEMDKVQRESERRQVKEMIRGVAIHGSSELAQWHDRLNTLTQSVGILEGFVASLRIQCEALNNEQIRRASARKMEAIGVYQAGR